MDLICWRLSRSSCLILFWIASVSVGGAAESVESVQQTVTELARVRSENARLESEWRWQSQTLEAIVEALRIRAATLASQEAVLSARGAAQQQEINRLSSQVAERRARWHETDRQVRAIADELIALRAWLPPRLSRALELPFRSLADAALPPGERMQHVAAIWARCAQFNRVITCESETLVLGEEENPRLLDVIYWGLSHGYALDRVRQVAYVGRVDAEGWTWRPEPAIAASVARLIAIFRDEADPEFVALPVEVGRLIPAADR